MRTRLIFLLVTLLVVNVAAQERYVFDLNQSELKIKGTSSLHDWEMKVVNINCNTVLNVEKNQLSKFDSGEFICLSKSLKSDNSLMDKKTYDALKSDKYKTIKFKLTKANILSTLPGIYKAELLGTLTLAGQSNAIVLPVEGELKGEDKFTLKGFTVMKMSDYNITPPTAMFGTITTGNEIRLEYDFTFLRNILQSNN